VLSDGMQFMLLILQIGLCCYLLSKLPSFLALGAMEIDSICNRNSYVYSNWRFITSSVR